MIKQTTNVTFGTGDIGIDANASGGYAQFNIFNLAKSLEIGNRIEETDNRDYLVKVEFTKKESLECVIETLNAMLEHFDDKPAVNTYQSINTFYWVNGSDK